MPHDPFLNQSQDRAGPQMPQLKAGQRLFNRRYELLRPLGAGGMGVVWLARDHTEEIEVALKFLPTVLVLQEGEMKRLREEVRAGKELRHPRLVGTYGMEVEDGIAAIVMEYVSGQTLKEKLEAQERGFFEPEEIERWVQDICEALDYLHSKAKRIHRDLKPANIIVDASGEARLMDFGISHRIKEGVTRQSQSAAAQASTASEPGDAAAARQSSSTLAYASPQQLAGLAAHAADDLYSLGATVYELLTGAPPFFRGSHDVVAHQIKNEAVTPIMARRAEFVAEGLYGQVGAPVSAAWSRAVLECLEKKRERRPADAARLLVSLQESTTEKSPRWLWPLVGAGVVTLAIALPWILWPTPASTTLAPTAATDSTTPVEPIESAPTPAPSPDPAAAAPATPPAPSPALAPAPSDEAILVARLKKRMDDPYVLDWEHRPTKYFSMRFLGEADELFPGQAEANLSQGKKFLAENARRPGVKTTASGLQYEILKEGWGAKLGGLLEIEYTCTDLNGNVFDSMASYSVSDTRLIPGLREGVGLMSQGGHYKFFIPSNLAFGEKGCGIIGPNETLVFEIKETPDFSKTWSEIQSFTESLKLSEPLTPKTKPSVKK